MRPMNKRRILYAPVLTYLILLVAVWMLSWVAELYQQLTGDAGAVTSLISSAGVRWALLCAGDSLNAAPWGTMALLVSVFGLLDGSGVLRLAGRIIRRQKASRNEWRSLLFALFALLLFGAILFMFTVSPWNTLAGVGNGASASPLGYGWPLVLLLAVLAVSLMYGFTYGNYRTVADVVASAGDSFILFVPAFVAMIPASGIVPCLKFAGMDGILGFDDGSMRLVGDVACILPFLYISVLGIIRKR